MASRNSKEFDEYNTYYNRYVAELQDKLKESEEERLKLEKKLNTLQEKYKSEDDIRKQIGLRESYNLLIQQEKLRHNRNIHLREILEKIENEASFLTAKTDRLRLLRQNYEAYIEHLYPGWRAAEDEFYANYKRELDAVDLDQNVTVDDSYLKNENKTVPEYDTKLFSFRENNSTSNNKNVTRRNTDSQTDTTYNFQLLNKNAKENRRIFSSTPDLSIEPVMNFNTNSILITKPEITDTKTTFTTLNNKYDSTTGSKILPVLSSGYSSTKKNYKVDLDKDENTKSDYIKDSYNSSYTKDNSYSNISALKPWDYSRKSNSSILLRKYSTDTPLSTQKYTPQYLSRSNSLDNFSLKYLNNKHKQPSKILTRPRSLSNDKINNSRSLYRSQSFRQISPEPRFSVSSYLLPKKPETIKHDTHVESLYRKYVIHPNDYDYNKLYETDKITDRNNYSYRHNLHPSYTSRNLSSITSEIDPYKYRNYLTEKNNEPYKLMRSYIKQPYPNIPRSFSISSLDDLDYLSIRDRYHSPSWNNYLIRQEGYSNRYDYLQNPSPKYPLRYSTSTYGNYSPYIRSSYPTYKTDKSTITDENMLNNRRKPEYKKPLRVHYADEIDNNNDNYKNIAYPYRNDLKSDSLTGNTLIRDMYPVESSKNKYSRNKDDNDMVTTSSVKDYSEIYPEKHNELNTVEERTEEDMSLENPSISSEEPWEKKIDKLKELMKYESNNPGESSDKDKNPSVLQENTPDMIQETKSNIDLTNNLNSIEMNKKPLNQLTQNETITETEDENDVQEKEDLTNNVKSILLDDPDNESKGTEYEKYSDYRIESDNDGSIKSTEKYTPTEENEKQIAYEDLDNTDTTALSDDMLKTKELDNLELNTKSENEQNYNEETEDMRTKDNTIDENNDKLNEVEIKNNDDIEKYQDLSIKNYLEENNGNDDINENKHQTSDETEQIQHVNDEDLKENQQTDQNNIPQTTPTLVSEDTQRPSVSEDKFEVNDQEKIKSEGEQQHKINDGENNLKQYENESQPYTAVQDDFHVDQKEYPYNQEPYMINTNYTTENQYPSENQNIVPEYQQDLQNYDQHEQYQDSDYQHYPQETLNEYNENEKYPTEDNAYRTDDTNQQQYVQPNEAYQENIPPYDQEVNPQYIPDEVQQPQYDQQMYYENYNTQESYQTDTDNQNPVPQYVEQQSFPQEQPIMESPNKLQEDPHQQPAGYVEDQGIYDEQKQIPAINPQSGQENMTEYPTDNFDNNYITQKPTEKLQEYSNQPQQPPLQDFSNYQPDQTQQPPPQDYSNYQPDQTQQPPPQDYSNYQPDQPYDQYGYEQNAVKDGQNYPQYYEGDQYPTTAGEDNPQYNPKQQYTEYPQDENVMQYQDQNYYDQYQGYQNQNPDEFQQQQVGQFDNSQQKYNEPNYDYQNTQQVVSEGERGIDQFPTNPEPQIPEVSGEQDVDKDNLQQEQTREPVKEKEVNNKGELNQETNDEQKKNKDQKIIPEKTNDMTKSKNNQPESIPAKTPKKGNEKSSPQSEKK